MSFKYDPFGRRIEKSTSTTSVFAYDGDNLIEETNSSGAVVARYEPTQNIDEPLAMLRSGATSYFHADGLGSVTSLSNAAGSIANTYTYDSFGKLTASTGSLINPFQYTAREFDTESALYYMRARYFDPQTGRFTAEDPATFSADVNFYRYALNDPINLVDPTGLAPTGWHRNITLNLGKQIFGPKCESQAKAVADANAATDDNCGFVGTIRFLTFRGPAWDKPGPHFPDPRMVNAGLNQAIKTCNLGDLGRSLHSLQDMYFHWGLTPGWHYALFFWDPLVVGLNGISPVPRIDAATAGTAGALQLFKDNSLKCCN